MRTTRALLVLVLTLALLITALILPATAYGDDGTNSVDTTAVWNQGWEAAAGLDDVSRARFADCQVNLAGCTCSPWTGIGGCGREAHAGGGLEAIQANLCGGSCSPWTGIGGCGREAHAGGGLEAIQANLCGGSCNPWTGIGGLGTSVSRD